MTGNITMMNIDPTHLAWRSTTAEETQKVLDELEAELVEYRARRGQILIDISKANDAAVRDQRARLALPGLNKEEASVARLARSIEVQIGFARKRIAMAANQAAAARAAAPIEEGAERLFLVNTPHHLHQVRHKASSVEALRSREQMMTVRGALWRRSSRRGRA
jgi:murein L,D-transpeptidase YcbB/YkuD